MYVIADERVCKGIVWIRLRGRFRGAEPAYVP